MVSAGAAVCLSGCQSVCPPRPPPLPPVPDISPAGQDAPFGSHFFGVHCTQQVDGGLQPPMENMGGCLTGSDREGRCRARGWASRLFIGCFRADREWGILGGRVHPDSDQILPASMDKWKWKMLSNCSRGKHRSRCCARDCSPAHSAPLLQVHKTWQGVMLSHHSLRNPGAWALTLSISLVSWPSLPWQIGHALESQFATIKSALLSAHWWNKAVLFF